MVFGSVEAGEHLHHIVDFLLLLGPRLVQSDLFAEVQQLARNNKLLSLDAFVELMVIDVDESELHGSFFFCIVIIELHFSQQQFCVVVVFDFEVSPLGHEPYDFGRIVASFVGLVHSQ